MRLTDLLIRKIASPKSGQKTYFDDSLKGFGVRVSQGGTKSYVVMYGKDRRLKTLGRYPTMTLKEARAAAKRVQGELALRSPQAWDRPNITFQEAKERFLADSEARNKPKTVYEYRRLLIRYFTYEKKLHEITRHDIMKVVGKLRNTPVEERAAFVAVRTLMNWAVKHGLIDASPVPKLTYQARARSRVLSEHELKLVWHRAEEVGYPYGRIIQLLIVTGQRRGEIAALRRSWINDDTITFPAGFTKNKREHTFPIGALTQEIINDLPKETDLLFPSRFGDDAPWNGWAKAKRYLEEPLQIAPWTLHDLRRTYSSKMAELGVPIQVTEKLLNHISGTVSGIAAVYNRYSYLEEMRDAVGRYEDEVTAGLSDPSIK